MASPIESALHRALIENKPTNVDIYDHNDPNPTLKGYFDGPGEDRSWNLEFSASGDDNIYDAGPVGNLPVGIVRQVRYLTYRLDFVVYCDGGFIDIECDGHDWHDRTKQQAAADRSRDRELSRHGIHVYRFTGSEIVHYADRCAAEVYEMLSFLNGLERQRLRSLHLARESSHRIGALDMHRVLKGCGDLAFRGGIATIDRTSLGILSELG